jgi:hypothetical protein
MGTKPRQRGPRALAAAMLLALGMPTTASAADGCQVMLCLSGNWKSIPLCVSPVREVLRDLARGKPFPTCRMADGGGSTASHQRTTEANCPRMYSLYHPDSGAWMGCRYAGVISLRVDGDAWADVFWSPQGNTSTRHHGAARAALGDRVDLTYDSDLRAWRSQASRADQVLPDN